jgi:hypothetical protein
MNAFPMAGFALAESGQKSVSSQMKRSLLYPGHGKNSSTDN